MATGDMLKALACCGIPAPANKRKFKILCPVHSEKTASCYIDLDRGEGGGWYCFGCGEKGDAADLVQLVKRVDFPEAKRILGCVDRQAYSARNSPAPPTRRADPAPADDPEIQQRITRARTRYAAARPLADTLGAWYLEARGIPAALAIAAGARYFPDLPWWEKDENSNIWQLIRRGPAVIFPVHDGAGQLIGAQARYLFEDPKAPKNNKKTFGVSAVFSAVPGAIDTDKVIVTEAPIDALSMAAVGFASISTLGTNNLPDWISARIARARSVYIALDNDQSGKKAKARWEAALASYRGRIFWLRPVEVKDWNEYLTSFGPVALERLLIRAAFPSRAPHIALDLVDLAPMLPAGCRVLVTSSGQPATVTGYTAPSEDLPAGSVQLVTDDGQRWDCDARGLADAAGLPLVPSLVTWRERIARAKGKLQTISGLPGV